MIPGGFYQLYRDSIYGLSINTLGNPRFFINVNTAKYSELHHHDYAELSFYIEGSGKEWIGSEQRIISPRTASFILPHHLHGLRSDVDRPVCKYRLMFDLQILYGKDVESEIKSLIYQIGANLPPWVEFDEKQYKHFRSVCDCLLEEYSLPESLERSMMIRSKLTEALLIFIRAAGKPGQATAVLKESEALFNPSTIVWPVLQFIHGNYTQELTLEKTSSLFNLSMPYLSRMFKEFTGKGFLEYIHFLRIESAASLLKHTHLSITEIALEVGFESIRTFTRVFRKSKGMSASEYRALTSEEVTVTSDLL